MLDEYFFIYYQNYFDGLTLYSTITICHFVTADFVRNYKLAYCSEHKISPLYKLKPISTEETLFDFRKYMYFIKYYLTLFHYLMLNRLSLISKITT